MLAVAPCFWSLAESVDLPFGMRTSKDLVLEITSSSDVLLWPELALSFFDSSSLKTGRTCAITSDNEVYNNYAGYKYKPSFPSSSSSSSMLRL